MFSQQFYFTHLKENHLTPFCLTVTRTLYPIDWRIIMFISSEIFKTLVAAVCFVYHFTQIPLPSHDI